MRYYDDASSTARPPYEESSDTTYFYRWELRQVTVPATETEPERTEWHWHEYQMSHNERNLVITGRWNEYTAGLRAIERGALFEYADKMVMKYSTDASDDVKRLAWIEYKRQVRATPTQAGYPQAVTYPTYPE